MTYVVQRASGYAGYYKDPDGRRRSTGIHPTRKEAKVAADRAEAGLTPEGKPKEDMILEQHYRNWANRPDPDILPNTVRSYEFAFRNYILPALGDRLVTRITRADVEEMFAWMRSEGVSEHQIGNAKAALGACLRVLVPHVITYNPTHGIKVRKPPAEDYNLLADEEISAIIDAMPTQGAQLFVYLLSATGLRHGEAAELRVKDIRPRTGEISVRRRVTDIIRKSDPKGRRFAVVPGTKAGVDKGRTIGVPAQVTTALTDWISQHELGAEDLIFPDHLVNPDHRSVRPLRKVRPGSHFYDGNRRYQHGTAYGYTGGGCRCDDCREALRIYRNNLSRSQFQEVEHLSSNTWGRIWREAVKKSGIGWAPRSYDLRHYFATTQVARGASLPQVARMMGHSSVETTMRYQRRVEDQETLSREIIASVTPRAFRGDKS